MTTTTTMTMMAIFTNPLSSSLEILLIAENLFDLQCTIKSTFYEYQNTII